MGTDYIVNVGPVVIVKNPPVAGTQIHKTCCNVTCQRYRQHVSRNTKFCEECGTQISDWLKEVKRPIEVDLYELLNKRLVLADHNDYDKEIFVLVPNTNNDVQKDLAKKAGFQHFNLKYGQECQIFPTSDEIHGYVETFKGVFNAELNVLRKTFGDDNVAAKYGILGVIC